MILRGMYISKCIYYNTLPRKRNKKKEENKCIDKDKNTN